MIDESDMAKCFDKLKKKTRFFENQTFKARFHYYVRGRKILSYKLINLHFRKKLSGYISVLSPIYEPLPTLYKQKL